MKSDAILREIERLSEKRYLPIIGSVKGKHLVDAIKRFNVENVLEVGTLIGYSAILIALNLPPKGRVVTIEMNPESARLAKANVRRAGLAGRIEVHVGNALIVIPGINDSFDMVFLDAAKDEYLQYLRLAEDKLEKGGVVFADNVGMSAARMRNYLDYVRNSGRYKSNYIGAAFDGVEISTKLF